MDMVSASTEVAAACTRLATSEALRGGTGGNGGRVTVLGGLAPQPAMMKISATEITSATIIVKARKLLRRLYACRESMGFRRMCSMGRVSTFMVNATSRNLRGLYRDCGEVVTL